MAFTDVIIFKLPLPYVLCDKYNQYYLLRLVVMVAIFGMHSLLEWCWISYCL